MVNVGTFHAAVVVGRPRQCSSCCVICGSGSMAGWGVRAREEKTNTCTHAHVCSSHVAPAPPAPYSEGSRGMVRCAHQA